MGIDTTNDVPYELREFNTSDAIMDYLKDADY